MGKFRYSSFLHCVKFHSSVKDPTLNYSVGQIVSSGSVLVLHQEWIHSEYLASSSGTRNPNDFCSWIIKAWVRGKGGSNWKSRGRGANFRSGQNVTSTFTPNSETNRSPSGHHEHSIADQSERGSELYLLTRSLNTSCFCTFELTPGSANPYP